MKISDVKIALFPDGRHEENGKEPSITITQTASWETQPKKKSDEMEMLGKSL